MVYRNLVFIKKLQDAYVSDKNLPAWFKFDISTRYGSVIEFEEELELLFNNIIGGGAFIGEYSSQNSGVITLDDKTVRYNEFYSQQPDDKLFVGSAFTYNIKKFSQKNQPISITSIKTYRPIPAITDHIETEDMEFNKIFDTYCLDAENTFYILDPADYQILEELQRKYKEVLVCIKQNHILVIFPRLLLLNGINDKTKKGKQELKYNLEIIKDIAKSIISLD